jgi:Helix-turn-helix domain/Protein of unknown function (DUF2690)
MNTFAGQLRELRQRSGLTLRQVAARSGYSASALSNAETGRRIATLPLTEAFVVACGGDAQAWRQRWTRAQQSTSVAAPSAGRETVSPADGRDPAECGCDADKKTVGARHVIWTDNLWGGYRNVHLGVVELRYSARQHAAWGRFVGTDALDHLAGAHRIDVSIEVHRVDDHAQQQFESRYCCDWHWSDVLLTSGSALYARAVVYRETQRIGAEQTPPLRLR